MTHFFSIPAIFNLFSFLLLLVLLIRIKCCRYVFERLNCVIAFGKSLFEAFKYLYAQFHNAFSRFNSLFGSSQYAFAPQNIFSHPIGNTNPDVWEKLAYNSSSPYNDTRPLAIAGIPENRKYRARGVINDTEIGQWSDILSVTFGGYGIKIKS